MIENIEIRNFKSIESVNVALAPVTVFIGRSGVGKSNFLRAIRFLRNFLLAGDNAIHTEGGWPLIYPFNRQADLSYRVRFKIPGYEESFTYEADWAHSQHKQVFFANERLRLGEGLIFGRNRKDWEGWPDARPRPPVEPKSYLSSFPTVSEAVLAFTFLANNIGWHDFPANVFRESASPQSKPGIRGLSDSASNYLDVLRDLTQNLQNQHARRQILARIRQINPSVASLELDSITNPSKIFVTHKVADQLIPLVLSQESDGFRRYYAHLLALYQTPPTQVVMFEEPENGIYPGALRNLAEEFQSAAGGGRGQVLLTTQSPDLLDGFAPETIRVVDVDEAQCTRIGSLDPGQLQAIKDNLLEPGELMTVDRARLAGVTT